LSLHFLILIIEILVIFLIFLAGLKVYKNYSLFLTELDKTSAIIILDTSDLFQKKPDAILKDYIGDFF